MRISQQIFPRPVALITSVNKNGKPNVMTTSFIMPVSFSPKILAISVSSSRYTFLNLKEVKEFVVNVCSEELKEVAMICGSYSGKETDKFELAELEIEKAKKVKPPLIKNCPISLECKIVFMKEFGDHWLIVGEVVEEHIRKKDFKPLFHVSGDKFSL
jgi:flavin reductase (DIM6/NTAB) family NADH-FMN oxidoreductase RutF